MEWLALEQWSPYAVGIGIGILSWITFLISDKPIGASSAYARTSGMIEKLFRGQKTEEKPYYQKYAPTIDWGWMLVLGIILGAFLSAQLSDSFELKMLPFGWVQHFGNTPFLRWFTALAGGFFLGFGARWAGGCTSGHGISGTLQMAISSWLAAICFFIGGIAAAMLLY
jgi:uncharacterized membrane protein YedE/YeeE